MNMPEGRFEWVPTRRIGGRRTAMLNAFIDIVEQGKCGVIYGPDFVVLSRKRYDEMMDKLHPGPVWMEEPTAETPESPDRPEPGNPHEAS